MANKLKTMKDLEEGSPGAYGGMSYCEYGCSYEIKQEAIKWVNGCKNNENMTTHNMCGFYYDEEKKQVKTRPVFCCCCERFMKFFNITEDELKDAVVSGGDE